MIAKKPVHLDQRSNNDNGKRFLSNSTAVGVKRRKYYYDSGSETPFEAELEEEYEKLSANIDDLDDEFNSQDDFPNNNKYLQQQETRLQRSTYYSQEIHDSEGDSTQNSTESYNNHNKGFHQESKTNCDNTENPFQKYLASPSASQNPFLVAKTPDYMNKKNKYENETKFAESPKKQTKTYNNKEVSFKNLNNNMNNFRNPDVKINESGLDLKENIQTSNLKENNLTEKEIAATKKIETINLDSNITVKKLEPERKMTKKNSEGDDMDCKYY